MDGRNRRTGIARAVLAALAIAWAAAPGASQAQAPEITAEIVLGQTVFTPGEPVDVEVTLTNRTDRSLSILKWNTPFEGFRADSFRVEWQGQRVRYQGPLFKRRAPVARDYLVLGPRESISTVVDLSTAYDTSVNGAYSVMLWAHTPGISSTRGAIPGRTLASSERTFQVVGGSTVRGAWPTPPLAAGGNDPTFENCSAAEQTMINMALAVARDESCTCYDYLDALSAAEAEDDPQYERWFGDYTAGRFATVLANWLAIKNALNDQSINFVCDGELCEEGDFAYVFPNMPYEINLCDGFFAAEVSTGTDTKMGTLIHEISHFDAVAGTEDHAYGTGACKALANSDPDMAIENADSYEYFAETKTLAGVPTLSTWGMLVCGALLLLVGARRAVAASGAAR